MLGNDYRDEYLAGKHPHNPYDDCRFAKDKVAYAKKWLTEIKGRDIDFENPRNIVDVICKEKVDLITAPYEKLLEKQLWADKILVRDQLKNLGIEKELPLPHSIYTGHHTSVNDKDMDIIWSTMMNCSKRYGSKFIIKTNHGSGWNMKVDINTTPKEYVQKQLNEWLSLNYAYVSGYEIQYKFIQPGIIVQPLLAEELIDWSFWCVDGEIEFIGLTKKFGKNFEEYIAWTDKDGNKTHHIIGTYPEMYFLPPTMKKTIEEMKPYVHAIAKPFKFVRVDLYRVNGQNYFGEATFTPCSGVLDYVEVPNV